MAGEFVDFNRLEFRHRMRHRHLELIGQDTLSQDEFDELTGWINDYIGDSPRRLRIFCQQFPATTAVFLVHCCLYEYTSRTANLWDGVWKRLRLQRTRKSQTLLGKRFLNYLREAKLSVLGSSTHRPYVEHILLHTPVPLDSMSSFFDDVIQPLAEQPDLGVADLGGLVKPLENFIDFGGSVAENLIARGVDLYRYLQGLGHRSVDARPDPQQRNGEGKATSVELLAERFGLPRLVVEHMLAWYPTRTSSEQSLGRRRMRLRFDPYDAGMVLEMRPDDFHKAFGDAATITIRVRDVDYPIPRPNGRPSFPSREITSDDWVSFRVPVPAASYTVLSSSASKPLVSRGVDEGGPTYFDPHSGRRLGSGPLPAGDVWVLAPRGWTVAGDGVGTSDDRSDDHHRPDGVNDLHLDDSTGETSPTKSRSSADIVVEDLPAPVGEWRRFSALGLNTKGCTLLRWYDENGQHMPQYDRAVASHEAVAPHLIGGDLFTPWLAPMDERTVFVNRAPKIWLPVRLNGDDDPSLWSVRCSRGGGDGRVVFEYAPAALHSLLQPWEGGAVLDLALPPFLGGHFGDFIVTVQGPLGHDARFAITLLRGIRITFPEETQPLGRNSSARGIDLFQVAAGDGSALRVQVPLAEVVPADDRGRTFIVHPRPDAGETVLYLSRVNDPDAAASVPIRLRPAEWHMIDLDPSRSNQPAGEEFPGVIVSGDTPDGGVATDGMQPLHVAASSVPDLATKAVVFRTFFAFGCHHNFMLYADGEPVDSWASRKRDSHPQSSWVDLGRFTEAIRLHTGSDLELRATVTANGDTWEYSVLRIQFHWQIDGLDARLEEAGDGGDEMVLKASWRETCPPRGRRKLVLEDRWRGCVAAEVDIPESHNAIAASFSREQFPPGRYTVGFVAQRGWRREAVRPLRINPEPIIDVRPDEWHAVAKDDDSVADWLVSLNAHVDGALGEPSPVPPLDQWEDGHLAALGKSLAHALSVGSRSKIFRSIRSWPLEHRLRIVAAAREEHKTDRFAFQRLCVALALPRSLTSEDGAWLNRNALALWPALLHLCGHEPLPRKNINELRYYWGYLFQLQHPDRFRGERPCDTVTFSPEEPARLLHYWVQHPGRKRFWRQHERALNGAYATLRDVLPKLVRVVSQYFQSAAGKAFVAMAKHLHDDGFRPGVTVLSDTAKLAFVYGALAALQRTAAYERRLDNMMEERFAPYESACFIVPELYDYYLLLAEVYIRSFASEGAA